MGYKKDALSGIFWIGGARGLTRGLTLLKNILVARMLAPADFGQFGAVLLVTTLFEVLTEFGWRQIIIQEKQTSEKFLSTTWTISIIRGGLIAGAVFVISPLMAEFFQDSALRPLFSVIALAPLLRGFINPGIILFQKELQFGKSGVFNGSVAIIDFLSTLSATIVFGNVWGLIFGFLITALAEMTLSFFISQFRPQFELNLNQARSILKRGQWLATSSIFNYTATQGDDILVARFLGLPSLGFYQLAFKLANLPLTEITGVLNQVILPIFSKIGGNLKRLRMAFQKTFFTTAVLGGLMALFLIIFAHPLVRVMLGEKWLPLVPPLRILAVFGVLRSLMVNMRPLFFSRGDFKTVALFDAARTAMLAILIFPLMKKYQIQGAALAILISLLAAFPWLVIQAKKILKK